MPKPLTPDERYAILKRISEYVTMSLANAAYDPRCTYDSVNQDRQFVADCVSAVIAEIDYVLSPVPDEDEIAAIPVEKTA